MPFCVRSCRYAQVGETGLESHRTKIKTEEYYREMKFYFKLIAIPSAQVYTEHADNVRNGRKRGIVTL